MNQNKNLPSAFGPVSEIKIGGISLPIYRAVNWAREEKIEEEPARVSQAESEGSEE